jgi:ferric-dicitrate binding protein FerR (iron transport regulator)
MFFVRRGEGGFLVKTKQGLVRVIGTNFNIYARPDGFEVTCYMGEVEVRKDGAILPLKIQEKAIWDGTAFVKTTTFYERPSWTAGEAVFKEAPLERVMEEVERQYGIRFKADLRQDYLYTGGIPHGDLQTAMDNIADALDLRYKQKGRDMHLTDKKE